MDLFSLFSLQFSFTDFDIAMTNDFVFHLAKIRIEDNWTIVISSTFPFLFISFFLHDSFHFVFCCLIIICSNFFRILGAFVALSITSAPAKKYRSFFSFANSSLL